MEKLNLKKSKTEISKELSNMHALDIAKHLVELEQEEQIRLIELIPHDKVDDVFIELSPSDAVNFFNVLDLVRQRILITDLPAAYLRPLFQQLNEDDKTRFYNLMDENKKEKLINLLQYSQTLAASVMQNDFIKLNINYNVGEAMRRIQDEVDDLSYIDILYVVDDNDKLLGLIYLKELIIARKTQQIESIIREVQYLVRETDTLQSAIDTIKNYDINVIPVIDNEEKIIGIITADDIFEELALSKESYIDRFLAVGDFDDESTPFRRSAQRLPWLLVSIVLNLVIALFLSVFSSTIDTVKALILFQPMILGMAGNIGTQSIAVTIVSLHLKRQETREERVSHIKKETLIGLLNSLIVAVLGFGLTFIFLTLSNFDVASSIPAIYLSGSIGLSLFFAMALSAFFGVGIPLLLTKFKIDPAAASGPVISTINDLVALVIYFGFATMMIHLLL